MVLVTLVAFILHGLDALLLVCGLGEYLAHVEHDEAFLETSCNDCAITGPVDVEHRIVVCVDLVLIILEVFPWIKEAPDQLLIFQRPNENVFVLPANS